MDGARLVGGRRRDRDRQGRRRHRRRDRGVDRPAGRLEDGARLRRRLRRQEDQQPRVWLGLCAVVPARARRLAAAARACAPRPARAALVLGLALVLQPRRRLHERAARLPGRSCTCSPGWSGSALRGRSPSRAPPSGRSGCSRRRPSSSPASGSGSTSRRSNVIDVGYAGVIGADRIANGEAPYGHMPVQERPEAVRRRQTRRARSASASRRTAAASRRTSAATPTARSPTSPTSPATCCFGWSGKWDDAAGRALHLDRLRPAGLLGLALVGRRFGGPRLAATLAFAWAAYPFTQYVSNSNTNDAHPAVAPDLGLLARLLALGARVLRRARGLGEVRRAHRRAALGRLPRGAAAAPTARPAALRRRVRRGDAGGLRDPAPRARSGARRPRLLGPDARLAAGPRVAVLDLGLGAVPRRRHPRPPARPAASDRAPARRRSRRRVLSRADVRRCSSPR